MNEKQKKKNKIIGISIGILVVLLVVISSTYAYWQITKSQEGSNDIIAACLNIDMQSVDGTFALDPAWPISDSEGMNLTGYKFRVTNNCPEDVAYVIGMDSLEVSGATYLSYDSIKVSIDNNDAMVYGLQEDIDYIAEEDDNYVIRDSKKMATAIVKNGQPNEHIVKVWIKSDAPVEEQSKVFSGRMFITGGQKIENDKSLKQATADDCFTMNGTEIIGYDASCGEDVTIPMYVGENAVTSIDTNAFKPITYVSEYYDEGYKVDSIDTSEANVAMVGTVDESGNITPFYIITYTTDTEILESINGLAASANISEDKIYASTDTNVPALNPGEAKVYYKIGLQGPEAVYGTEMLSESRMPVSIKSLDLSMAYNLEKIEEYAFSNITEDNIADNITTLNPEVISLTSLTFGKNDKEISIGNMAFAGISVDNLTIYTSHTLETTDDMYQGENGVYRAENFGIYLVSEIDNLIIKPAQGKTSYGKANYVAENISNGSYTAIFDDFAYATIAGTVTFADGITEIISAAWMKPTNILLPNSLVAIRSGAFALYSGNITIPSSVMTIEADAFDGMASTNIITMQGRTNLDGMTLGDNWSGEAQISYSN